MKLVFYITGHEIYDRFIFPGRGTKNVMVKHLRFDPFLNKDTNSKYLNIIGSKNNNVYMCRYIYKITSLFFGYIMLSSFFSSLYFRDCDF